MRRNYAKLGGKEMARRLNRSEQSVWRRAQDLGIAVPGSSLWAEDEIRYLQKHYGTISNKTLGEELGRSEVAVQIKAKRLGLTNNLNVSPTKKQVKWIVRNLGKIPYTEMARRIGCSASTVQRIAEKHGFQARPQSRLWTESDDNYLRKHYGYNDTRSYGKKISTISSSSTNSGYYVGANKRS